MSESPDLHQAAALGIAASQRHVQKELWEPTKQELLLKVLSQTSNSDPRCAVFSCISKHGTVICNQNNDNCNKPYFYHMNAFTLFWLNIIFYDNIQQSFSINVFQVYTSYSLLKKGGIWEGSHCLSDIKMHWHLVSVNLSGLWLLLYSQARFPRFFQPFGDFWSCSIKLGPSFKYSGNWTSFKP